MKREWYCRIGNNGDEIGPLTIEGVKELTSAGKLGLAGGLGSVEHIRQGDGQWRHVSSVPELTVSGERKSLLNGMLSLGARILWYDFTNSAAVWYCSINNETFGPYSERKIGKMALAGVLNFNTLAATDTNWRPISRIPQLKTILDKYQSVELSIAPQPSTAESPVKKPKITPRQQALGIEKKYELGTDIAGMEIARFLASIYMLIAACIGVAMFMGILPTKGIYSNPLLIAVAGVTLICTLAGFIYSVLQKKVSHTTHFLVRNSDGCTYFADQAFLFRKPQGHGPKKAKCTGISITFNSSTLDYTISVRDHQSRETQVHRTKSERECRKCLDRLRELADLTEVVFV
jgi:GYF domain 2